MSKEDLKNYNQLEIDKLIEENELKTKWLSLIAHDFKGMFHNIVYLLKAYEKKDIPQDLFLTMLPEIRQIAEKNLKTLESTFSWVNAHTDGFELQVEDVSIYELFLELKNDLQAQIESKNINIHFIGDKSLVMQSDKLLLAFILKQTLENAIKYSNKDGEIEFITSLQQDETCIEIKDQGIGMSDNEQANIFSLNGSPYKGTRDEIGSGLSMVIVKDFVQKIGGNITVFSKLNEGTSVRIMFSTKL